MNGMKDHTNATLPYFFFQAVIAHMRFPIIIDKQFTASGAKNNVIGKPSSAGCAFHGA